MGEIGFAYGILVGSLEGSGPVVRPKHKCEGNIEIDPLPIRQGCVMV
jgi:hypothetical protein